MGNQIERATSAEVRELCEVVRDFFLANDCEVPEDIGLLIAKHEQLAKWLWSRFEANEWKGAHKYDPLSLLN